MKFKVIIVILIIILVLAFGVGALFLYSYLSSPEEVDNGLEYDCYVAVEVKSDGDELTAKGIKKHFGTKGIDSMLSVILKDTGDCGVCMGDYGFLGTWEKDEEDVITISGAGRKIKIKKKWGKYRYTTSVNNHKIEIILEMTADMPAAFRNHPEYTYGTEYDAKATKGLCNFMLDGHYVMKGKKLYGRFFDDSGECILGCSSISGGENPQMGKVTAIQTGGVGKFLTLHDGYLYFMWVPSDNSEDSICRVSLDGGEPEVLRTGQCDYVQVRYGRIYFTNENYRFCSMKLNGEKEKVVIDREVYMPYVFDRNWIIYQDDADKEHLHVGTLDGKYDRTLTDEHSYEWAIQGRTIYYTSTPKKTETGKHKCRLNSFSMDEMKTLSEGLPSGTEKGEKYLADGFVLNRSLIFGEDGGSEKIENWKKLSNDLYAQVGATDHMMYVSDRYKIVGHLDEAGEVTGIELTDLSSGSSTDITD